MNTTWYASPYNSGHPKEIRICGGKKADLVKIFRAHGWNPDEIEVFRRWTGYDFGIRREYWEVIKKEQKEVSV